MKFSKKSITSTVFVIIGMTVGVASVVYATQEIKSKVYSDPSHQYEMKNEVVEFQINKNGETYGSCAGLIPEQYPDLVIVTGDNGKIGYCRSTDLNWEKVPSSPEEALKIQEERIKSGITSWTINVYDKEGIEVIDTFTIVETANNIFTIDKAE